MWSHDSWCYFIWGLKISSFCRIGIRWKLNPSGKYYLYIPLAVSLCEIDAWCHGTSQISLITLCYSAWRHYSRMTRGGVAGGEAHAQEYTSRSLSQVHSQHFCIFLGFFSIPNCEKHRRMRGEKVLMSGPQVTAWSTHLRQGSHPTVPAPPLPRKPEKFRRWDEEWPHQGYISSHSGSDSGEIN